MNDNNKTSQQAENQIAILADQFIAALHELESGDNTEDAAFTNAAQELTGKKIEGRDEIHRFWVNYKNESGKSRSDFHHITIGEKPLDYSGQRKPKTRAIITARL